MNGAESEISSAEALFVSQLGLVERVVRFVCARYHVASEDADDFASHAKVKVVEEEYAILRKFAGRSSLRAYLTVVIDRLLLDYRISAWGKWRPSAEARRNGSIAVLLDQLIVRDGHSFDEACQILTTNHRLTIARQEIERLATRLPGRVRRRFESDDRLIDVPAPGARADGPLIARERAAVEGRLVAALRRAKERFDPQDRLIIAMRFEDGRTVADIATVLRLDQKSLYRRLEKLLRQLRAGLESDGVTPAEVREVLDATTVSWDLERREMERSRPRPSIGKGAQEWR